ncbi:glycosyltransferase family 1 protein [Ligilactobacillus pobuzihii]|uniref:glycosyltransferase family 1 protein n=1 Tax=Ligilactobacillus pobuzihii TaxID=449659 RepID=UPI0019D0E009|nr:glycosyltransferase family 1 protein [Ligilactobacillus pobuzihii]MBN7275376.1 glycosyltransferase family 1 protein [Ligilactobacillus pobuzihii]
MEPVNTDMEDIKQGNIHDYDNYLEYFNNKPVTQDYRTNYHSVTFVSTGIIPYDGGITTMLHLGTLLSKKGYDVYYQSCVPQKVENMQTNAEFNFPGYQGTCLAEESFSEHNSDIWIATLWETAYLIKNLPGYKMYFVQDYEPYFYPYGDRSQLAKRSYELGLHMVSLGPWCAEMVRKQCKLNSPLDQINFPVDVEHYQRQTRDFTKYPNKKELNLAVYTKFNSPRRAPINLQLVLYNTEKLLAQKKIKLNINYFGTNKSEVFINGKNLGKLSKNQLRELYYNSDFGIAPSMTNFSLVPFEMMSCGLPFIDFEEGTGQDFIPDDCCWYTRFNEYDLAELFEKICCEPHKLERKTNHAKNYLNQITWKKTLTDFLQLITHIERKRG